MDEVERALIVKDFGQRLRELRYRRGLSQEAVALRAGLAVFTYARIERGKSANPTLQTSLRIIEVLNLRPEELALLGVGLASFACAASEHLP
uniref:helix-turn-helix transcriptional regulator n=1 Tax=Microbacterium azadirachtae TaxID=582680 RepID=UPI000B88BA4D|nr:helix-turn-helix transcriptional regulator [Microbacterium azadirachtae]